MNVYKAAQRRNNTIKSYQKAMSGPKGEPLFVRSFATAKFAMRKSNGVRKVPLCGNVDCEPSFVSADAKRGRIVLKATKIADARLWGEIAR